MSSALGEDQEPEISNSGQHCFGVRITGIIEYQWTEINQGDDYASAHPPK